MIVGGLPISETANSVAEILVYSDQQEAGEKGPAVQVSPLSLGAAGKPGDFRPALSFFWLIWFCGEAFSLLSQTVSFCSSKHFIAEAFKAHQTGGVSSGTKVNLQATVLSQFGRICIHYPQLLQVPI